MNQALMTEKKPPLEYLVLVHPGFIFNPPEFDIGNASSPSPLSSHFGKKVIKLMTANVLIVLRIDPDSVGPEAQ